MKNIEATLPVSYHLPFKFLSPRHQRKNKWSEKKEWEKLKEPRRLWNTKLKFLLTGKINDFALVPPVPYP